MRALVLAGGNALGAYHAGVWCALREAGETPDWVAGCSIGAASAAIIAGTAPEATQAALDGFWARAAGFDFGAGLMPAPVRDMMQYGQAMTARLFGQPSLFTLRPDALGPARPGLFDLAPMRTLLAEAIDIERLNGGPVRLSVMALDAQTGGEVVFDTRARRVELDHVLASLGLLPDFAPMVVEGRTLVDGGLAANLPLHLVLDPPAAEGMTVFGSDLFALAGGLPRSLLQAAQRQSDLLYASQTLRTVQALERVWAGRAPGADLVMAAYQAMDEETAIKGYDFGAATLARRRAAGLADMQAQIGRWRAAGDGGAGLRVFATDAGGGTPCGAAPVEGG